jgi:NADPH-dependent glutamate synthase beta subunit-like oxidoreductase
MPRKELQAEIDRIENMGVTITLNHRVEDVLTEKEDGGFDALFVAVGAHISKKIDIPNRDAGKILDAVSFLSSTKQGEAPKLGRRVAIYGGGNTAMDAARTAKRLGVDEAMIIYRRDRSSMPAHDFEADEGHQLAAHDQGDRPLDVQGRDHGARRNGTAAADRQVRGTRSGLTDPRTGPGHRHGFPRGCRVSHSSGTILSSSTTT